MTTVSPPRIEMTEEIQSTCGYKCGQCCLHCCCTIKYDCFSKKSKCKCTPYTTSQGAAATTGVGGAMTACLGTCMLLFSCCPSRSASGTTQCLCGRFMACEDTYIAAGSFLGTALAFAAGAATIWCCNKHCGKITNKLGCTNFSKGFDHREE